ncbi:hypothetical protein F2Q69_00027757 [Brassica cretica]|uniref:Uncharacterized protein n=1 Tax=Brassica cretica TaxID=69181 RepID=A0A8S9RY70_BRACR|nr:hypothetical protein F2Q69_00027757 [Brassica cretica]
MHGLMSYRRFGRARSLRSDQAERTLGRYVATELGSSSVATAWLKLGRYVATGLGSSLVATYRPSGRDARLLRSDRARPLRNGRSVATYRPSSAAAERTLGRYVATERNTCFVVA